MRKLKYKDIGLFKQIVGKGEYKGILFINVHYYRSGEFHEVHQHADREEIFICFKGKGKIICNGVEEDFYEGEIAIFEPTEKHGFKADSENPFAYICIGVKI